MMVSPPVDNQHDTKPFYDVIGDFVKSRRDRNRGYAHFFDFGPFLLNELQILLKRLKSGKACGPDDFRKEFSKLLDEGDQNRLFRLGNQQCEIIVKSLSRFPVFFFVFYEFFVFICAFRTFHAVGFCTVS